MFERFTEHARAVMSRATEEVQRFGHDHMGTEHIFLGLIKEDSSRGAAILKDMGVEIAKMASEIEQLATLRSGRDSVGQGEASQAPEAMNVVKYAAEEAKKLGCDHIGTEHILLGLLRESEGVAAQVLANLGVGIEAVRASLE